MRGPGRIASRKSVRDRIRRLPRDTWWRIEAKMILQDNPENTLAAMRVLLQGGDVKQSHVDAHVRWLNLKD